MKAKKGVIEHLNNILTAELTAGHQYIANAAMCKNWGYERLHHEVHERAIEEISHSESIVGHILYLEGTPNLQRLGTVKVGKSVVDQFKNDLALEMKDLELIRKAITHCSSVGDFTTRHKLEEMSVDTDGHIDWLETQLETIKQVGLENYLSEQMKKSE